MFSFFTKEYGKKFPFVTAWMWLLSGIKILSEIALTWYLGAMITKISEGSTEVFSDFKLIILFLLLQILSSILFVWIQEQLECSLKTKLRKKTVSKIMLLQYGEDALPTEGDQLSYATNDINALFPFLGQFFSVIRIPIGIMLPIALMVSVNGILVLVLLPVIIISLVSSLFFVKRLQSLASDERKQRSNVLGFFNEVLDFVIVIKSYMRERFFLRQKR